MNCLKEKGQINIILSYVVGVVTCYGDEQDPEADQLNALPELSMKIHSCRNFTRTFCIAYLVENEVAFMTDLRLLERFSSADVFWSENIRTR